MEPLIAAAVAATPSAAGLGVLAHRPAPRHPPRDRLGSHRGDHRHHEHDRGRGHGRGRARRSAPARSPATSTATAATHEVRAHDAGPGGATLSPRLADPPARWSPTRFLDGQAEAIRLGTLYALGHGAVVIALGLAALAFGALLPDWLDPIMGRVVGLHPRRPRPVGHLLRSTATPAAARQFRLRSRWMLVFDGVRYGWRRFQARLHGHEHVEPLEMSSYGAADVVRGRDDPRDRRRDRHRRSC